MKFCQYEKPIMISLSPNTEKDDIDLALKVLFKSKDWKDGKELKKLEQEFKKYLGVKYVFAFNSGRAAFMAILEYINIEEGDEVLLQAFTCNAAVNPILEKGAEPVFVDIDDTLNINPEDLKEKISPRSKAVIVQHNFGWPAEIGKVFKIVKENNLFLIEDCAHSLGAGYIEGGWPTEEPAKTGTFGDVAFFSFGRDKIISSVYGGMVVTDDYKIAKKIEKIHQRISYPSNFWIFQQLLHPILVNYCAIPAYGTSPILGKILLGFFQKLAILSKAVQKEEKRGKIPPNFQKKLPNALATLALHQFQKLEKFNTHRREIAKFYKGKLKKSKKFTLPLAKEDEEIVPTFMRYPLLVKKGNTDKILKEARKRKIYLNDGWRKTPVVPPDTDIGEMKYIPGSCPRAEEVSENIVNLPTHINVSKDDAKKIVDFLKSYGRKRGKR
jgi:dTDP-4-amino-4,6-dideoxygalactose transaminase